MLNITPRHCRGAGWVTLCALLAGCAEKPAPPAPQARVFASDFVGGSKRCTVPAVSPVDGKETPVALSVGNDGGWCAIGVQQNRKAYAAGLLIQSPAHGKVFIHPVGDTTRIDYTPDRGFTGADAFVVKLIPGDAVLRASVTVTP